MYKHILESAGNINWMAIGPLVFFVIFFIGVTIMAYREKNTFIDKMSNLPLDDSLVNNKNDK